MKPGAGPPAPTRRRVLVGTAGHVDHGKTTLIEALTGIDCDRWQEEKDRGITIDLGFAHLEPADRPDLTLGFVDVPGHERFVDNALAGLGGIKIVLLVVAADEGVKPQTHEHLDICTLLEIPAALVALTKADLVAPDLLELARLEVEELLAPTPFANAAIVPVSATSSSRLDEFRDALLELADRHALAEAPEGPARLPIDRSFVLPGLGTIVTGTLAAGAISAGDTLELVPGRDRARVRSVQVHGRDRERALAGERVALRLAGVDRERLLRGAQLISPEGFFETRHLAATLRLLAAAEEVGEGWTPVRFHLASAETPARIRALDGPIPPAGEGRVEIRLARPVAAAPGDRWICRRLSPAATLGGGAVLDPAWTSLAAKNRHAALRRLEGQRSGPLLLWIEKAGLAGRTTQELAERSGTDAETADRRLGELAASQKLLKVPDGAGSRWILPAAFRRLEELARNELAAYFRAHPLAAGMPKAEFLQQILPRGAHSLSTTYLAWLEKNGTVAIDGHLILKPGRSATLSDEESKASQAILGLFRSGGLAPPAPSDVSAATGVKRQILDGLLRFHVERGELVRLPGELLIAAEAVASIRSALADEGWEEFSVAEFKDRFSLSRKWAIPLLEHLDSIGVTRRVGNARQVMSRAG